MGTRCHAYDSSLIDRASKLSLEIRRRMDEKHGKPRGWIWLRPCVRVCEMPCGLRQARRKLWSSVSLVGGVIRPRTTEPRCRESSQSTAGPTKQSRCSDSSSSTPGGVIWSESHPCPLQDTDKASAPQSSGPGSALDTDTVNAHQHLRQCVLSLPRHNLRGRPLPQPRELDVAKG